MKPLYLILSLLASQLSVLAAENAGSATPGTNAEDKPFNDPFAAESGTSQAQPAISDPWERTNRTLFKFNDRLFTYVLEPVGKGYKAVTPQSLRESIGRLFTNAKYPVRLVNNAAQGKFKGAGVETERFVINTTVGIGGLLDPAASWNLEAHPASSDQTLASYGVHTGNYIVVPIFGPSTVRGVGGLIADAALTPWSYIYSPAVIGYVQPPVEMINKTSLRIGDYEAAKKATLDFYAAARSAYFEDLRSRK